MTIPPLDHEAAKQSAKDMLDGGCNDPDCKLCNEARCYLDAIARAEKAERENAELRALSGDRQGSALDGAPGR